MSASSKVKWLGRDLVVGPFLTLCTTEPQFRRVLRKLNVRKAVEFVGSSQADASVHAFENQTGDLVCVVCLRCLSAREPIQIAGLLVHEAVHVWQQYRDYINEPSPCREFEAYAIQSIAQRLMASYVEQTGGAHAQVDPA